ncbi:hypothetical protein AA313_de0206572 [Arthrobotrys entomopaga]|nr:hypothetical protein AA313_de0206572 [Arthrobotrys entomopaga]
MVAIKSAALITLLGAVSALPVPNDFITEVTLEAVKPVPNSSVPWKDGSINANHQKFYIGEQSALISADNQVVPATATKASFLLSHTHNTLGLNVAVLGGQQVYIDDTGALRYLVPRDPLPSLKTKADDWHLNDNKDAYFYNQQVNIWWACPPTAAAKSTGPWQIFADTRQLIVQDKDVPSGNKKDCTIFDLKAFFSIPLSYNNA